MNVRSEHAIPCFRIAFEMFSSKGAKEVFGSTPVDQILGEARRQSDDLRNLCTSFNDNGSDLLGGVSAPKVESTAAALKRQVSGLLESVKNLVGGSSSRNLAGK